MRLFPAPGHFELPTPTSTALPTDSSSSLPIILKQKKDNGVTRQKRHDQMYDNAKETKSILIGESGMIKFTRNLSISEVTYRTH